MSTTRLEAFSDAVIAIALTIMVLDLKVPRGSDFLALRPVMPTLGAYVLSFVILGIYWNNHHHMIHATERVNGNILWANLHLLFWLSLVPFVTAWIAATSFAAVPTAVYGLVLLLSACAYTILQAAILAAEGHASRLARAIGKDLKGKASVVLYAIAIPLALVAHWVSLGIYVVVALIWLVPDRRIERHVGD